MNHVESASFVVFDKICDILKENYLRLNSVSNPHYLKEQITSIVPESFLISANRKWLTGESCC